ncbi:hypothetical protein Tco_0873630, partial [Tanacetum coccineum]
AEVPSASSLQVIRRLGSIFILVYTAVQKLKKDSWLELQFSLAENSKLNVGDPFGPYLANDDPRSRLKGIFAHNIARPLHGVKLLGGPASVDFNFSSELVMKRVAKTIRLMDAVAKINDP